MSYRHRTGVEAMLFNCSSFCSSWRSPRISTSTSMTPPAMSQVKRWASRQPFMPVVPRWIFPAPFPVFRLYQASCSWPRKSRDRKALRTNGLWPNPVIGPDFFGKSGIPKCLYEYRELYRFSCRHQRILPGLDYIPCVAFSVPNLPTYLNSWEKPL